MNKSWSQFKSLRWQVLYIVILATAGFTLNFFVNLYESQATSKALNEILSQRYPLTIELQKVKYSFGQVQEKLEDAVVTGDLDNIAKAENHKDNLLISLNAMSEIDASLGPITGQLADRFERYFIRVKSLAYDLAIDSQASDLAQRGKDAREMLLALTDDIDQLNSEQSNKFKQQIQLLSDSSLAIYNTGLMTGLVTVFILIVVAWLLMRRIFGRISYMSATLRHIAEGDFGLNARIPANKNDEMSELADWFNVFISRLEHVTNQNAEEMEKLANTDVLTGLANRRRFNRYLESVIANRVEPEELKLFILFIDLDFFKRVNDQYGHDTGDLFLKEVGNRLTKSVRKECELVARMGGDEFMILVSDKSRQNVEHYVFELIELLRQPIFARDLELHSSASIGLAEYPLHGDNADKLVANADIAMYEAKRRGKNMYCWFSDDIGSAARLSMQLDEELREALSNDHLDLYIQPKFSLVTGEVNGGEILLRWQDAIRGEIKPSIFIEAAERSNFILELDRWVMRKVFVLLSRWQAQSIFDLPVAMNISAKLAGHPSLPAMMQEMIEAYPIKPGSLEIEITETAALRSIKAVASNIRAVKGMGIKVGLDDFGTGHSSLTLLKYCEIDTLKIDQVFVEDVETVDNAVFVIESLIQLATKLEAEVVAEGVESMQQVAALKEFGCDSAQGYILARPMPLNEFERYIGSQQ